MRPTMNVSRPVPGSLALSGLKQREHQGWLPVVGALIVIAVVIGLVLLQMVPPAVVARSAPAAVFSAERAMDHLRVIARAPHPTGSAESLLVRDYLAAQLTQMGLDVEIQSTTSVYHDTGKWGIQGPKGMEVGPETWGLAGATVHNVMARIPGTQSSGAVVMAAHYDSVPYGPGASDDGVGTAAILETARALLSGSPPKNDIILLLTDGEEIGLLGAQAFADHHPWMQDIAVVLNLEARGSGGTVLMYETNEDNAWIIREYARAAVAPLTGSVATDVYRMMPNSSDLTVFFQGDKQGMNFAYGENWTAYHTTQDSIEDLDPRSLQHHGANALALAKHFASLNLADRTAGDAVFFSVLRLGVIHYPKTWVVPLMIAAAIAYILVLALGLVRRKLSWKGIGLGIAAFLAASAAAMLAGFFAVRVLDWAKGGLAVGMGGTYNVHGYELGLLLVYLPITGAVYAAFQRKARPADLAMGALFFWLALTIGSTLLLAGASYMFLLPLVAGLLVLAAGSIAPSRYVLLLRLFRMVPVIIGLVLVGTVLYLVQLMFGAAILPAGGFLTVLIMALIFPDLEFRLLRRATAWAAAPALTGVVIIAAAALLARTQPDQPQLNFHFYSLDADMGKAGWVAQLHQHDDTLLPLLRHDPREELLANYFPTTAGDRVWVQDAPALDALPPELRVVSDTTENGQRTLRLNLRSPRGAYGIMADVLAEDAILSAGLYGERYSREDPRSTVFFKVIGVPEGGVEVELMLRAGVPVTIRLADITPGLPLDEHQQAAFASGLRSGYGGGHGIDSTTLIHRVYAIP